MLLVKQTASDGRGIDIEASDVDVHEQAQQVGVTALLHPDPHGFKKLAILAATVAHGEHGEAPLILGGGHQPLFVADDRHPGEVIHRVAFVTFALDDVLVAGNQPFELAFRPLVTGPACFVQHEEQVGFEVAVEV